MECNDYKYCGSICLICNNTDVYSRDFYSNNPDELYQIFKNHIPNFENSNKNNIDKLESDKFYMQCMIFDRDDDKYDIDNRCVEVDGLFSTFHDFIDEINKDVFKNIYKEKNEEY